MPGLPDKASSHNKKRAFMIEATKKKRTWRPLAGAAIVISVAAIAGQSVLASLNATAFNTTAQNINTGTLKLEFTSDIPSVGFGQGISNLVPGDVVNRYITIQNTGTLNGKDLKLGLAATGGTTKLLSDVSKGLQITVRSCAIAWTLSDSGCANPIMEISKRPLQDLISTPAVFSTNSTLSATGKQFLQVKIELPDQNEVVENGALSTDTIQGRSVDLKYTFDLAQEAATTKNS